MRVRAYTATAKLLHWLVALLALGLIGLGFVMRRGGLPLGTRFELYQLHKSIGFVVLVLMVVRLIWRARHAPPPLPLELSRLTRGLAQLVHVVLYALLIMLPLTGWMMVSVAALPVPTRIFGLFEVPHIPALAALPAASKAAWEAALKDVHMLTAYGLLALVTLHVAAALHHHFRRRDDVLRRMLPGRGRRLGGVLLLVGAGAILTASSLPASAREDGAQWRIDAAASRLQFEAQAGGQGITGRFGSFEASIRLTPDDPATFRLEARIATGSLATGNRDIDGAVREAAWLDVASHPVAIYRASGATREADGRFAVDGRLSLKGVERPVRLVFRLETAGREARAVGEAIVPRSAFGIGPPGPIAGFMIGDEVRLRLEIVARRSE